MKCHFKPCPEQMAAPAGCLTPAEWAGVPDRMGQGPAFGLGSAGVPLNVSSLRTVSRISQAPCSSTVRTPEPAVASSPRRRLSTLSTTFLGPVGARPLPLHVSVPAVHTQHPPAPKSFGQLWKHMPDGAGHRDLAQVQGLSPGCATDSSGNSAKSFSSSGPRCPHLNSKGISGL